MGEPVKRRVDWAWVWLAAMLLLALALRVHRLGGQSLWYDEAVTAQVSAQGLAELTRWTADDIQPPLYYYAVAGWTRLAGRSGWALRFPSAFFGVLTVALLWAAAQRLFGRGRRGRWAAGIAGLLAALSPLYIYYAQEARMYTLLTGLGVLAGYALLRTNGGTGEQGGGGVEGRRAGGAGTVWWVVFVLASAAMLYTHYFGLFLLMAYGICWLAGWLIAAGHATAHDYARSNDLSRSGRPAATEVAAASQATSGAAPAAVRGTGALPALAAFLASILAIVVLYLPWLPVLLNRYQVDRSYWQGALKLNEALRHVAISFTAAAPETMLEGDAVRLLPWFGLALIFAALALALLGARRNKGKALRALVCLSACLLVPILAVLLLASRTPKFNPRYLMLASPAYLLILAGGIGALVGDGVTRGHGDRLTRRREDAVTQGRSTLHAPRLALAALLTAFLVAVSFISLRNWFADPAFTKAQWRELAAYVRQERTADETVLLVSGHAYPAWDYYAADIPPVRLPAMDVLDVDARLGFGVGADLAAALAGKSGAWLITWQDDVVDPVGFVPYFLDRAGREQAVPRQFWHLGLRHWQLTPGATYPAAPQPQHADAANFDHKLALLGWDDPTGGRITVYWRTLNTLPADYQVSLILEDAAGHEVGRWDGRPAGYSYPTTRWRPGEELFGRYPLPLPAVAAPGEYFVTLAVYDDAHPSGLDLRDVADNPAGKRVRLGPVRLAP